MKAVGNGFPAVGARGSCQLPDPDRDPLLVIRTWIPSVEAPERHSPNCRARCCGSWHVTLPACVPAPLLGDGGGQAPALAGSTSVTAAVTVAVVSVVRVPTGRRGGTAPARRRPRTSSRQGAPSRSGTLRCAAGCGAPLDPVWAAETGRDRHGVCAPAASTFGASAVVGGGR